MNKQIPIRLFMIIIPMILSAQVGIGTTQPEADLHVAGSMIIQEAFELGALPTVLNSDEDFKLLTRTTNSTPINGEITRLDVNVLTVAPINIVKYRFHNLDGDNLVDVDLGYETSKYIVGIADFRYIGDPVNKNIISGTYGSIGAFVLRSFESGGTWHLEIRNKFLDVDPSDNVEYQCTLIIYDTSFYRKMPVIRTNLNGSNQGTAITVPNLY
ncbi:hypothetical protein [Leeuwenhoekiella sp. H156]|uniref:hypothetical protein n=1 Tax=Leeuwenhoekiella sp. H156 TaxID=3450128 RepID=UPI003FA41E1D